MSSQLKKAHSQGNYTFIENATVLPFGSHNTPTEKRNCAKHVKPSAKKLHPDTPNRFYS